MTKEQLHDKYGFKEPTIVNGKLDINPICKKHIDVCWIIQDIYSHVHNESISLGKARELVSAVIEEHINKKVS